MKITVSPNPADTEAETRRPTTSTLRPIARALSYAIVALALLSSALLLVTSTDGDERHGPQAPGAATSAQEPEAPLSPGLAWGA